MLRIINVIILGIAIYLLTSVLTLTIDFSNLSDNGPRGAIAVVSLLFYMFSAGSLIVFVFYAIDGAYTEYNRQIKDIEKLQELSERKNIHKKKAAYLTEILKTHLAEQYPQYEKDIFSNLLPENISAAATLFPDIRASETIMKYCDRISSLTDVIYAQDLDIAAVNNNIRVRLRNKVGWWFLLPRP